MRGRKSIQHEPEGKPPVFTVRGGHWIIKDIFNQPVCHTVLLNFMGNIDNIVCASEAPKL